MFESLEWYHGVSMWVFLVLWASFDAFLELGFNKLKSVQLIFNINSFWVGHHYSIHNQRTCYNFVPCITLAVTRYGGVSYSGRCLNIYNTL